MQPVTLHSASWRCLCPHLQIELVEVEQNSIFYIISQSISSIKEDTVQNLCLQYLEDKDKALLKHLTMADLDRFTRVSQIATLLQILLQIYGTNQQKLSSVQYFARNSLCSFPSTSFVNAWR